MEKSSKTNTSSSSSLELEDQPAEARLTSSSCGGLGDRRDPDTSDGKWLGNEGFQNLKILSKFNRMLIAHI